MAKTHATVFALAAVADALAKKWPDEFGNPLSLRKSLAERIGNDVTMQWRVESIIAEQLPNVAMLRQCQINDLDGTFTEAEIRALAAALNGTLPTTQFLTRPETLLWQLEDFERLDGGVTAQGADWPELRGKLSSITAANALFIQREIWLWWNSPSGSPAFGDLFKIIQPSEPA